MTQIKILSNNIIIAAGGIINKSVKDEVMIAIFTGADIEAGICLKGKVNEGESLLFRKIK